LQRLAGHFLDVVAGLTTLKVFGRSRAQIEAIGSVTERYRRSALATLRITFLSSLVLELIATLAVALVAVAIGLRLLNGAIGLRAGLFALVLAPEAYLPLRRLGANYHASQQGTAAAEHALAIIEARPGTARRSTVVPDPASSPIVVEALTVSYPGRAEPALSGLSLTVKPGEILALAGPSGCGKSTLLGVLLGLVAPSTGSVRVGGVALGELDRRAWHERLAWMPQRPHLFNASILENVRAGRAEASEPEVLAALGAAGLGDVVRELPRGLHTPLGEQGAGLSAGERQRLGLARAFVRDAPLLLLDEPTAALDAATERELLDTIRGIARGRTVVVAAHRPALLALADSVVRLAPARVTELHGA
jgi:thiol reductant ABC exporter CydD subunit